MKFVGLMNAANAAFPELGPRSRLSEGDSVPKIPSKSPTVAPRKSGGAVALGGFAYQLLGSIDWSTEIAFERPSKPDRLASFTVTLEPAAGADAAHASPRHSELIQYKTRGSRPWTESAILQAAMPDLVRATASAKPDTVYRFQTNAAANITPDFIRLQHLLRQHPLNSALKRAAEEGLRFKTPRTRGWTSARAFLDWAMESTAAELKIKGKAGVFRDRFVRILGRLTIEAGQNAAEMNARILERLSRALPYPEQADRMRRTLLGTLLDHAQHGDRTLTIGEIFQSCGLAEGSLRSLADFQSSLVAPARLAIDQLGYDYALDSRQAAPVIAGREPIALGGPSGVGKTWMLARAARAALERGDLVIWIDDPAGRADVQAKIANLVQSARGHTAPLQADGVRTVVDAIAKSGARFRITVFLDRFRGPDQALGILSDPWWASQDIGLIAALPAASHGDIRTPQGVVQMDVPDFSLPELRRYLLSRGLDWSGLANDVRKLLQRPNLASLYADVGRDWGAFAPANEYQLMEMAWRRAPAAGSQGAWQASLGTVRARLAEMFADLMAGRDPAYPWPRSHPTAPFTDADIERLERGGLLRWTSDGLLRLDHDRLLAWGLAEAGLAKITAGAIDLGGLGEFLADSFANRIGPERLKSHALGYLALDLFWGLLSPQDDPDLAVLEAALAMLRAPHGARWSDLATLGARGFRLALSAAEQLSPDDDIRWWELAAALAKTTPLHPTAGDRARIRALLGSDVRERRQIAMKVLQARPDPTLLRRLVDLRATLYEGLVASAHPTGAQHDEMDAAMDAARATAVAFPDAVRKLATARLSGQEAETCAYLVLSMPPRQARTFKSEFARQMLAMPSDRGARLLPSAARHWPGPDTIAELAKHGASDMFAFEALGAIAPDQALKALAAAGGRSLLKAVQMLGPLARRRPGADDVLAARIREGKLEPSEVAFHMSSWAGLAGAELWRALGKQIATGKADYNGILHLLGEAPNLPLLDVLREQKGQALEKFAFGVARERLATRQGRSSDHELVSATALLTRIGGGGLDRLTILRLAHDDDIEVRAGLRDALVSTSPAVAKALETHARNLFAASRRRALPSTPYTVLALIDPARSVRLARWALAKGGKNGIWLAGEIALIAGHGRLAQETLAHLPRSGAARNDYLELRLLANLVEDGPREQQVARRALAKGDSFGRLLAADLAERHGDQLLLAKVADELFRWVTTSGSPRDSRVLGILSRDPVLGPQTLDRLRALPAHHLLHHLAQDAELDDLWAKAPLIADQAMSAAFEFDSNFLNTPRDGQVRMWQIDPAMAIETFDEGLRRGGRASIGLAEIAVRTDPKRAATAIVQRFADVEDAKVRVDLARALRGVPDQAHVRALITRGLTDEAVKARASAIELAGWIPTPEVTQAILQISERDPRSEIQSACDHALGRADRVQLLAALVERLDASSDTAERLRLLAIAADMDVDGVAGAPTDPLYLGKFVRDQREWRLVAKRFKT